MTYNKTNSLNKKRVLSVDLSDASSSNILEYIEKSLSRRQAPYYIVTPNPEIVVMAERDPEFLQILNQAQFSLCDGTGLWLAAALLGKPLPEKITGVDFMLELCKRCVNKPVAIGFFGGQPGIA